MIELTPKDEGWPKGLDELGPHRSPERLFVEGDLDLGAGGIAIVGTRRPSYAGLSVTKRFARGIAEAGFVVVSGLAVGVDQAAHAAALEAGGHTIAVLGCGLDVDYPKANHRLRAKIPNSGALVSEYVDGTQPHPGHFPERNRIVAGLSLGTIVIEGGPKSGALITARIALDANRSVWAVPGALGNPMAHAPNELIKTGRAALVSSIQDVFDEIAPGLVWGDAPIGKPPEVSDDEAALLRVLDETPVAPGYLSEACGMAPGQLALALSSLEVRGMAVRRLGSYAINEAGIRARAALARAEEQAGPGPPPTPSGGGSTLWET